MRVLLKDKKRKGEKIMKKKLVSALLCVAMVATMLAGCGGNKEADSSEEDAQTSTAVYDGYEIETEGIYD